MPFVPWLDETHHIQEDLLYNYYFTLKFANEMSIVLYTDCSEGKACHEEFPECQGQADHCKMDCCPDDLCNGGAEVDYEGLWKVC